MSIALLHSRATLGIRAIPVRVEIHLGPGLPPFLLAQLFLQPLSIPLTRRCRRRLLPKLCKFIIFQILKTSNFSRESPNGLNADLGLLFLLAAAELLRALLLLPGAHSHRVVLLVTPHEVGRLGRELVLPNLIGLNQIKIRLKSD